MVIVLAIVSSMIGLSVAKIGHASMNATASNTIAMQASNIASSDAALLHAVNYEDLAASNRSAVSGTAFQHETLLSNESSYTDTIKQKIVTINVYKGDESIPRATLSFNRYSVSQNESSIPKGTILPWYGKSSDIPDGFAICDGTKGTPDLRNRFLVGAGSNYALGDTGGKDQVKLTGTQIGNHYHYWSSMYSDGKSGNYRHSGLKLISFLNGYNKGISVDAPFPSGNKMVSFFTHNAIPSSMGTNRISSSDFASEKLAYITSLAIGTAAQEAHENRPPYYALYYIMKLE